jgi:hypothetical protein
MNIGIELPDVDDPAMYCFENVCFEKEFVFVRYIKQLRANRNELRVG